MQLPNIYYLFYGNYVSVEKGSVTRHIKCKHSDERPYKCTYYGCNQAFKTSSPFYRHLRIHSGEKRYSCSICQMKFAESVVMKAHVLTHTDIKLYSWDICGKCFRRKYPLDVHKRKMH